MSELKPCPFCGAMPMGEDDRYMCSTLGCVMQEDTISAKEWNTRPIEDALNKRIAELEEKLAELVEVGNKMRDLIEQDYDGYLDETIEWRGVAEEADDMLQERKE